MNRLSSTGANSAPNKVPSPNGPPITNRSAQDTGVASIRSAGLLLSILALSVARIATAAAPDAPALIVIPVESDGHRGALAINPARAAYALQGGLPEIDDIIKYAETPGGEFNEDEPATQLDIGLTFAFPDQAPYGLAIRNFDFATTPVYSSFDLGLGDIADFNALFDPFFAEQPDAIVAYGWSTDGADPDLNVMTGTGEVLPRDLYPFDITGDSVPFTTIVIGVPDLGDGVVGWTISGTTDQDCNVNGISDAEDISSGTSLDCNADATPDECQLAASDCNSNASPDDCDIAFEFSQDCQGDGLPDECQLGVSMPAASTYCQDVLADDDGVGPGPFFGATSMADIEYRAADDFMFTDRSRISAVTWQGVYFGDATDHTGLDCFTINVHSAAADGTPVEPPLASFEDVPHSKSLNARPPLFGTNPVYDFSASIDFAAQASVRYWLSIIGDPTCGGSTASYAWVASPDGNANQFVGGDQPAQTCSTTPLIEWHLGLCEEGTSSDLAFCIDFETVNADCNANGVPDECDFAGGTSQDCNDNGIADECDVAAGTSPDCDANLVPDECQAALVFADDFDVDTSDAWAIFSHAGDFTASFAFDYSVHSIPPAPHSGGGTTKGLKFTVNSNDGIAATDAVSAYPLDQGWSGDYTLEFDMWINYNGGPGGSGSTGSTEYAVAGINHLGDKVVWRDNPASDGFWFAVTGEGGASQDYEAVRNATVLSVAGGGFVAGSLNATAVPFYQTLFPSPEYESTGSPGKHWVTVDISQHAGVIDWRMNGTLVASRADTSITSGNILLGYQDIFASISGPGPDNFVIFDNIRVTVPTNDCNANLVLDVCDISGGTSVDCNANARPDECELAAGSSTDCNGNDTLDDCDLAGGTSDDCNANDTPDECEPDCNGNGVPDDCDIASGTSPDCNGNGLPDDCEADCNSNGVTDECDITGGTSDDCNDNSAPDECEIDRDSTAPGGPFYCDVDCDPDCNSNGKPDLCDIAAGTAADCNLDEAPDECDIAAGTSLDADSDGVPDECIAWVSTIGFWDNAQLWDDEVVPDNNGLIIFFVTIDTPGADVTLNIDAEIETFALGGGVPTEGPPAAPRLNVTDGNLTIQSVHGMRVDGDLVIGPGHGLIADAAFRVAGTKALQLAGSSGFVRSNAPSDIMTLAAGIRGFGEVGAAIVNQGAISADTPGETLSLRGPLSKSNSGIVEALSGATLELVSTNALDTAAITGTGAYRALGGTLRLGDGLGNVAISGASLDARDFATVQPESPWSIALSGDLTLRGGSDFDPLIAATGSLSASALRVRGGQMNLGAATTADASTLDVSSNGTVLLTDGSDTDVAGLVRVGADSPGPLPEGFTPPVLQMDSNGVLHATDAEIFGPGSMSMATASSATFSGRITIGTLAAAESPQGFTPPVLSVADGAEVNADSVFVYGNGVFALRNTATTSVNQAIHVGGTAALAIPEGFTPPVLRLDDSSTANAASVSVSGAGTMTVNDLAHVNVVGLISIGAAAAAAEAPLGFTPPVLQVRGGSTVDAGAISVTGIGAVDIADTATVSAVGAVDVGAIVAESPSGFTPPVLQVRQSGTLNAGSLNVSGNGSISLDDLAIANVGGSVSIAGGVATESPQGFTPPVLQVRGGATLHADAVNIGDGGSLIASDDAVIDIGGPVGVGVAVAETPEGPGNPASLSVITGAKLTVGGDLSVAPSGAVDVDGDSSLRLGGALANSSSSPLAFTWDAGTLKMMGTTGVAQQLEAAGENRGSIDLTGFVSNFALGTLELSSNAVVQVVDLFDNQADGSTNCDEALYVDVLIVHGGSLLLTDGCRVFYNTLVDDGGSIPRLGLDVVPIGSGDLNGDNVIDENDFFIFVTAFASCMGDGAFTPDADFDDDGCVTLVDYQAWLHLYRDFVGDALAQPPIGDPTDIDEDGDVDLLDFAWLQRCLPMPTDNRALMCATLLDVDASGAVNRDDFRLIEEEFTGPFESAGQ